MARACTVCTHPERASIDEAVTANRGSIRGVARQHGLTPDALERHVKRHLPGALVLASKAREATRADDLLGLLREGVKDARRLRKKAEGDRDYRCAVAAVKTMSDIVEKLAAVAERLGRDPDGATGTLADLVARVVRVEYVNDWRGPDPTSTMNPARPSPSYGEEDEAEPIPARLVS